MRVARSKGLRVRRARGVGRGRERVRAGVRGDGGRIRRSRARGGEEGSEIRGFGASMLLLLLLLGKMR